MIWIFVIFAILISWGFYATYKSDKKEDAKIQERDKQDLKWLEEENKNGRHFRVVFILVSGEERLSKKFTAYVTSNIGWGVYIKTNGYEQAVSHLKNCYRSGYFMDKNGKTYPASNIQEANVRIYERE